MCGSGAGYVTDLDPGVVDTNAPPSDSKVDDDAARTGTGRRSRLSEKGRKTRRTIIEWTVLIGSALLIAILIKTFLFQAFYIPSESMKPTLNVGDRVLVNKVSYRLHDVNRGDIVVFKTPPGGDPSIKDLVKRVIALPGETIETRQGRVYINGRVLKEPYLVKNTLTCGNSGVQTMSTCQSFGPVTVPRDYMFVMGDNRAASKDSRFLGDGDQPLTIKESSIVGRVFVRIWPLNDLGFL
jgi:signal peptidase I